MSTTAMALSILLAVFAITFEKAQCVNETALPVERSVIGKSMFTTGCSRGSGMYASELNIEDWGIIWRPSYYWPNPPVCLEEIVAVFGKSDKPAMLLHRRETKGDHFKTSHPKLHKKCIESAKDDSVQFPCESIKVMPISVWGPQRGLFKKLVGQMTDGIRYGRKSCVVENYIARPCVEGSDLERFLERYVIATNALVCLQNLAYSNFFCVQDLRFVFDFYFGVRYTIKTKYTTGVIRCNDIRLAARGKSAIVDKDRIWAAGIACEFFATIGLA